MSVANSRCYQNWNDQTRLKYDLCARQAYDKESLGPGIYKTNSVGYHWCEKPETYVQKMCEPIHQQKQYRSGCYIDQDSQVRHGMLTDKRYIHQLWTRPYLGSYMGAGQRSLNNKDLESELIYGLDTRGGPRRACDVLAGVSIDRFQCLPEFGNPQRVQHVVEPWIRGGENTRDYVRRVNYEAKCANNKNSRVINKQRNAHKKTGKGKRE